MESKIKLTDLTAEQVAAVAQNQNELIENSAKIILFDALDNDNEALAQMIRETYDLTNEDVGF